MDNSREQFLDAANRIGARLCRDALWACARCNWLGDSMEYIGNSWTVAHRAFGPDVYSGTSGVALFLSRLFRITGEKPYRTAALGAARQAISMVGDFSPVARAGFYSGLTGVAWVLIELAETLSEPSFQTKSSEMLRLLAAEDPGAAGLDVVSGSAGAIPAWLGIYRGQHEEFLLDLAIRHGDHLLTSARRGEVGWSWDTMTTGAERHLTGFSHGTAGIAWALLELFHETGQEKFRDAAREALRYERHWFSAAEGNWPDFRSFSDSSQAGEPGYMVAWCHGAPGIGLSRLRAFTLIGEEELLEEARIAVETTARMMQPDLAAQSGFSLCHGLGGNADLLLRASAALRNPALKTLAEQAGIAGIERYERNSAPWPCGVPGGGETPGLLLGLAGIGHFYLRLYDPQRTPSVLIVHPDARPRPWPGRSRESRNSASPHVP